MAIIEQGKCKITHLNNKGLGQAISESGKIIELPYVLPDEIVVFEKHGYRRQENDILKEIIHHSPNRVIPKCGYFQLCGGCLLQHLSDDDYKLFKENILKQALFKYNLSVSFIENIILIQSGNRRRCNLEMLKKNDQLFLGFHRFRSHQIINLNYCHAILPELSELLTPIKESMALILENKEKGQIFLTKAENGIDILIRINDRASLNEQEQKILYNFALNNSNITRIIFSYRKKILTIYEKEEPYILFSDHKVEIKASSFLQASFFADKILLNLVLDSLNSISQEQKISKSTLKIADLFCGLGTYSFGLSAYGKVDCYESDKFALNALGKAAEGNIFTIERDLFAKPLTNEKNELNNYDFLVLNPPRSGAYAQVIELAKSNIKAICYISCNPESFARDALILSKGNFHLQKITPVDQFYWSNHLELVALFILKN